MATRTAFHSQAVQSLALTVIQSANAPLALLDGDLTVIAASTPFCRAFQITGAAAGRPLIGPGGIECEVPELRFLLKAALSGQGESGACEMDLVRADRAPRRLVLDARKLEYGEADGVRLLVTVADVTEDRAAGTRLDDLVAENAKLLRVLRHRAANSLRTIAAMLLQTAMRASSEETRSRLYDAHHKVMTVAAVQQQLASGPGDISDRRGLSEPDQSLSDSMIGDRDEAPPRVQADDGATDLDVSVSLGLIVAELVSAIIEPVKAERGALAAGAVRTGDVARAADRGRTPHSSPAPKWIDERLAEIGALHRDDAELEALIVGPIVSAIAAEWTEDDMALFHRSLGSNRADHSLHDPLHTAMNTVKTERKGRRVTGASRQHEVETSADTLRKAG